MGKKNDNDKRDEKNKKAVEESFKRNKSEDDWDWKQAEERLRREIEGK